MRYTTEMYKKNNGKVSYGRVLNYDHMKGYGFIHTEEGADIFLSSYNLSNKQDRHITVGALVSFVPELYGSAYSASQITIINEYPAEKELELPNGDIIRLKNIKNIGYSKKGSPCLYIATRKGKKIRITAGSEISDGSLAEYWKSTYKKLFTV